MVKLSFKDFLISKNIKFVEMDDEDVLVDEYTLIPFTEEIKQKFPDFEFIWEYRRYKNEPKGISG